MTALRAFWDRLAPPNPWASYHGAEPWRDMVLWPFRLRVTLDLWRHVEPILPDSHAVAYLDIDTRTVMVYARPFHLLARLWRYRVRLVFEPLMALGVWDVPEFGYIRHDGRWRWDFWRNERRTPWRRVWRALAAP